jgi:hypothetical protein
MSRWQCRRLEGMGLLPPVFLQILQNIGLRSVPSAKILISKGLRVKSSKQRRTALGRRCARGRTIALRTGSRHRGAVVSETGQASAWPQPRSQIGASASGIAFHVVPTPAGRYVPGAKSARHPPPDDAQTEVWASQKRKLGRPSKCDCRGASGPVSCLSLLPSYRIRYIERAIYIGRQVIDIGRFRGDEEGLEA